MLINRSGTMVVPFMTMYATHELGFTIVEAGIIMGLFGLGAIVGTFIGGRLTDSIGFYNVQLVALLGGGMMFIVLGFLKTYPSVCIGMFALSTINEAFRPANSTAIAYYSQPENRTRSYSLNRLAINLGWAFGGTIGGFLAEVNYHLLFWVDGITNISAACLLLFVLPFPKGLLENIRATKEKAPSGASAYRDNNYLWFVLLTVLFAFCFFHMFTILPVYYRQQLHLTESMIGILMAVNGLLIALTEMVLIHNLDGRRSPLWFIKYGVLLVGVSYALFNLLEGQFLLALIAMLIITIGEMLSMPFMNTYWISRSHEHNRGQYAALYSMGWAAAQILAPSVGGFVADKYGFAFLWWMIFAITVLASLGYVALNRRSAI